MMHIQIVSDHHLDNLEHCGGVYEAVVDPSTGKRVTPVVGYAGKYNAGGGEQMNWVGDVYYNFAMAESYPRALAEFARGICKQITSTQLRVDCILGAPMGGLAISFALAERLNCRYAFAEKKTTALATETAREQSRLVLDRHELAKGWQVVLGEDVCNNFSTTEKLIELTHARGAEVVAIICAINRSMNEGEIVKQYNDGTGLVIPVISALEIPTMQYRQDDPHVAEDIEAGRVVWKAKDEWGELVAQMRAAKEFIQGSM